MLMPKDILEKLEELEKNKGWKKIADYDKVPHLYKKRENESYYLYEVLETNETKIYENPIQGFSIVEDNQDPPKYYVFVNCKEF